MNRKDRSDHSVYERLRAQIDKMPVGMPKTGTGEEIRILQHLFTPREAEAALYLNIIPEPVERIHKRMKNGSCGYTMEETENFLKSLAAKGAIFERRVKGKKAYSYLQFVVGMFELQVDRMTPDFARDSFQYTGSGFACEMHRTGIPQLRAVPINSEVVNTLHIKTYDDVRELVRTTPGQFGLMNCICKQRKDLIGNKCTVTDIRETCITFPLGTGIFRKFGVNRNVSKDEIYAILDRAEKEGLVVQMGNSRIPMVVCCCCGDCCEILISAKQYPRPAELFTTNYYAVIDEDTCSNCGICARRCQMDAPVIRDGRAFVDSGRCIGCIY